MIKKYLGSNTLSHLINLIKNELSNKVDIVSVKDLSTNDYTNDEKDKVSIAYEHAISSNEELISKLYPIGSIYLSTNSINPSELLGFGTWQQIKDRFLLAAGDIYTAGTEGGEAQHTLTIDEIPSHNHTGITEEAGNHTHKIGTDKDATYNFYGECWSVHNASTGAAYYNGSTSSNGNHKHSFITDNIGGSQAHNNMPPYLAVYMWQRIM